VLNQALDGTDLTYSVVGKIIVIRPREMTQAQRTITGTVTSEDGDPLPGVNILIKGTQKGTITGADGRYSIDVSDNNTVLVFSFVGYQMKEVPVENKTVINVTLTAENIGLQEVVTVAYGTQKRINLTGSVEKITSKEVENRPVSQLSQALTGQVTGMTIIQRSGKPGADAGTIRIRGVGTFSNAGKSPMVLVNGIEASMNDIDPNDIESISVLKDAASAAIYGSRAANGLILITTKAGKQGTFKVSYNGYAGWVRPTKFPDYLPSAEYAELYNEALENDGSQPMYSEEEIQKFKDGSDPDNYPNTDWLRLLFSESGFQTNHNFNFSGGSNSNTYSLSIGYLNQKGLAPRNYNKRYSFRLNLSSQISKTFDMTMHLSAIQSELNEPIPAGHAGAGYNLENIVVHCVRIPPTTPAKLSDGSYGFLNEGVPYGWIESNDPSKYEIDKSVMHTDKLSSKEIEWMRETAFRRFYLRPSKIIKEIWENKSNPRYILNLAKDGLFFLFDWVK
jgi:TonB-linked SusC/RagA family outer membrane protein